MSTESCFGCAGERCLANSVVLAVGDAHAKIRDRLVDEAKKIVVGDGLESGVTMGPLITKQHRDKVLGYIEKGIAEGAKLLLDGRGYKSAKHPDGYFVGPTIFDDVTPEMVIGREEIFGPVLCIMRAKDFDEAVAIVREHELGNATSIFTSSGKWAREYSYRVEPSMLGVNIGVAAPWRSSFGGAKGSFFGDLKAHGRTRSTSTPTRRSSRVGGDAARARIRRPSPNHSPGSPWSWLGSSKPVSSSAPPPRPRGTWATSATP